ncbi:hypothetical protein I6A60_36675 [Frankia sp. AgB1.9]|uniref:hypothetical protein n=1 Tax=unclassified Frankia TaxID=2632575 RepID=UPI001934138C|nr:MULTISPECIES: hypothetical protein [unclassified Frankia]MBL7492076.1 hypothetical protein [Frankia sp. AgW1.1]MBL7553348.1 hypothetical protein [Frankia sp. AgB1.9]MBL7620782.1 hypothetical protein [Frankia sp. AgB1.8]
MGAFPEPPEGRVRVIAVVTSVVAGQRSARSPWVPAQRPPSSGGQAADLPAAVVGQSRGVDRVVLVPVAGPSPAAAIVHALRHEALPPDGGFVWLLDESSRPAPDALDRLLACAALDPGAAVLGPTGITVDRSGRRRPAPGEPMAVRDVLAVDRVGALVRAPAWRLLNGPNPLAGRADDVDLCWRAWRAGLRVVAVPTARLLPTPAGELDAGPAGRVARTDALRVRIAQSGFWGSPGAVGCVVLAGLARTALTLGRGRFRAAGVEALVLAGALADPTRLWRLRRRSASQRQVPARALRGLLPRLARPGLAPGLARVAATPAVDRVRRPFPLVQPPVLLAVLLAVAGCVLTDLGRDGGRPAALPRAAGQLWTAVWSGWLGSAGGLLGGPGPAPPWTPMLALLSSALGGRPELAARVLIAGAAALAGLAAYGAGGTLGGLAERRWARAGLAACYALAPPVTAAAQAGSLAAIGACVAAPVLLAAAVQALAPRGSRLSPAVRTGRRPAGAGWASWWVLAGALLLGVACAPGLLPVAAVGLVAAVIAAGRRAEPGETWRDPSSAEGPARAAPGAWRLMGRVGVVLLVGCAPLLPALGTAARGGVLGVLSVLLDEPDRAGVDAHAVGIFAVVCAFAMLLGGRAVRTEVVVCWLVASAGWVTGQDPLAAAGLLAGVGLAWSARRDTAGAHPAPGARSRRAEPGRSRRALALVLSAVLAAGPVLLFVRTSGWLGRTPEPVSWRDPNGLISRPAGTAAGDGSAADPSDPDRTLVLRPSAGGVTYTLTTGPGPTLIDTAGDPSRPAREFLAAVVADLSVGGGWGASALPALGVDEVWLPTATGTDQSAASPATLDGGPDVTGPLSGAAAGPATAAGGGTTFTAGGLVAALDAADGLERDQPRPDGYYWRLGPAAGPVAELRLLAPGPVSHTDLAADLGARTGTVAAARAAVAERAVTGPGLALAGLIRTSGGTSVDARVPAGTAGRLLVLAEPADPGWRATLAGRRLVPVTAWGWAQGFVVPAGPLGEVRVRYDHTAHRGWVLAETVAVAAFLLSAPVLALAAGRRRRESAGRGATR